MEADVKAVMVDCSKVCDGAYVYISLTHITVHTIIIKKHVISVQSC
jgi:hypothetical protein